MKGRIPDSARLEHILESIDEIGMAIKGLSYEAFVANHVVRMAVVKWLEIIGEAANNVSEEMRQKNSQVEWRKMISMRNYIVHEYFGVDFETVWATAKQDLQRLKEEVTSIKTTTN